MSTTHTKPVLLTDADFQQEVIDSDQPVLVDFWAAWCGPCRAVGPTIDDLAVQFQGTVKVGKVNIDENPEITAAIGIQSIPAVLLFQNGQIVESLVGVRSHEQYVEAIERIAA